MTRDGKLNPVLIIGLLIACPFTASAADILNRIELDRMGLKRYWQARVPLPRGEQIQRAVLLDDNLYLLSDANRAYAVHARTGVIRWTALVADPGQTVRGPTHSEGSVFFTAPGSVKVLDRRTGELAGEPRNLRGVIIEVTHDIATISIGEAHGVRLDDVLDVVRVRESGEAAGKPLGQLRITVVKRRGAKGRLIRSTRSMKIESGNRVRADVVLPLESVKLPFAASSPAVADATNLYVGAANQRMYSLRILGGFRSWQIMTPHTLSTTPVLYGENLYFGGQDGRIVSCTKSDRVRNWVFQTEGPIFVDMVVDEQGVYVASNDRLLYCLNRRTGIRIWRKRFDNAPVRSPRLAGGRIFQEVPNEGLFVLDAATGEEIWHRLEGGRFLAQFEKQVYLVRGESSGLLIRVDAATGAGMSIVDASRADFVVAGQRDQLILLATRGGEIVCLRPASAPSLRPAELASVLRDDRKIRDMASLAAEAEAAKAKATQRTDQKSKAGQGLDFLDEDDWLASRSTATPVGGKGLVDVPNQQAAEEDESAEDADIDDDEEADEDDDDDFDEDEDDEDDDDEDDEDFEDDEEDDEDEDDDDDD